jgi:hypothetical protein
MASHQAQWDKEIVQLHPDVRKWWHFEMDSLITQILIMLTAKTVTATGKLCSLTVTVSAMVSVTLSL